MIKTRVSFSKSSIQSVKLRFNKTWGDRNWDEEKNIRET